MNDIISENTICDPSNMKKSTMKKSRRGLSLELISKRYGDKDKVIPARRAPTSIDRPKKSNVEANTKHQPIENNNNNSCDFAIDFVIRGKIKNPIKNRIAIKPNPFKNIPDIK